ncbi:hypothetical protein BZG36_04569 [Bifiguratus adelaidae]|uniref:Uncharacterized protein n=1 Tax=Bifiguratus adelaidae TaxID=1938954 RepID=A0A261XUP6_9FUNG|nr:hypothetical protein BZG36_04569 [Bifiguratus adelaidae]
MSSCYSHFKNASASTQELEKEDTVTLVWDTTLEDTEEKLASVDGLISAPATCEVCGQWMPSHAPRCPRRGVHPSQW